eukprot:gene14104-20061_t
MSIKAAADIKLSGWNGDQVGRAVSSLLTYVGKQKDSTNEMFDDDETIYMLIALKKMPMVGRKDKPVALRIPHPLVDVHGAEVCLFVKDHDGTGHKEVKKRVDKLEKRGGINKVIGIHKLRTKYESFEAKRKLCKMYDIFLADDSVMPSLPKLIGKSFFKKKKQPIPINLKSKDLAAQIRIACSSTYLFQNSGTCMNIKVGTSGFNAEQLDQNLHAALSSAVDHIPNKWFNIQAVYIKTAESVALPLWQCLPESVSRIDASTSGATDAAKAKKKVVEAKPAKPAAPEKVAAPKVPAGTQRPKVAAKGKAMKKTGAKKKAKAAK